MSLWRAVRKSSGLYPITQLYLVAVGVVVLLVNGLLSLGAAITILGVSAVIAILVASWHELQQIHHMVDGQRTELLSRIDELSELLNRAGGVKPPPEDNKVTEARTESDDRAAV